MLHILLLLVNLICFINISFLTEKYFAVKAFLQLVLTILIILHVHIIVSPSWGRGILLEMTDKVLSCVMLTVCGIS